MINKGDIFVYPLCGIKPNQKYCVDEVYQNEHSEWMAKISWEDLDSPTGRASCCYELKYYQMGYITGHIKFIGNKNHRPTRILKRHCFNPTSRKLPFIKDWDINPYKESNLFDWTT
jgi:hypothetical protein